jgi:hypothetical protein
LSGCLLQQLEAAEAAKKQQQKKAIREKKNSKFMQDRTERERVEKIEKFKKEELYKKQQLYLAEKAKEEAQEDEEEKMARGINKKPSTLRANKSKSLATAILTSAPAPALAPALAPAHTPGTATTSGPVSAPTPQRAASQSVITKLKALIGDEAFGFFHKYSIQYLQKQVDAYRYHSDVSSLFEDAGCVADFATLFPQLVKKLPDPLLREDLMGVHLEQTKKMN